MVLELSDTKHGNESVTDVHSEHGNITRLATYIINARGRHSASSAQHAAINCVFDLVGTVIAGLDSRLTIAVRRTALKLMGHGSVPIWFSGHRSSVIGAAWANCAAASALDLDDGNRQARGHPGASVIPTAFAVAHETNASWDEVITAIVVGYEIGVAVATARTKLGHSGTWAAFAVVATAAALRGTPLEVLENALAIAGDSAPNQLVACSPGQTRSDIKEGIPWSVVTGLTALELAETGHTGSTDILDCAIHYKFPQDLQLGSSPVICNTYFKLYACCRYIHAPIDALLEITGEHNIAVPSIELVEVETHNWTLHISNQVHPSDLIQVLYSTPYCLALAATRGPSALLPVTADALVNSNEIAALASKVKIKVDPELDKRYPAETVARLRIVADGKEYVSKVATPLGEASNPLSWEDFRNKFNTVTRLVVSQAQAKTLLAAIERFRTDSHPEVSTAKRNVVDQRQPAPLRFWGNGKTNETLKPRAWISWAPQGE